MLLPNGFSRALRPTALVWSLPSITSRQRLHQFATTVSFYSTKCPPRDANPSHLTPPSISSQTRHLMRSLAHPLIVILASHSKGPSSLSSASPTTAPTHESPSGLLVSSFNTVTLDPTPYVSFNLKIPSRTYDAIASSGSFTANAICSTGVANAFAGVNKNGGKIEEEQLEEVRKRYITLEREADGTEKTWRLGDCIPDEADGPLWWMRCEWVREKSVKVGDHILIIGKVAEVGECEGRKGRVGIVYADGHYRLVEEALNSRKWQTYRDVGDGGERVPLIVD